MEKELRINILRMTENANWAKEVMPTMIEIGLHVLNSEDALRTIKDKGRDNVISYVAYKLVDQYY
ncbi:hypothetical protein MHB77_30665 [Paenibacillus sp. FSL K6-3166]|uniref:hypothetical protein n=1 Tax=Paenibacillus sp. FSL K6-3166 TaxID=2921492 RepID=UPI0030F9277F